MNQSISGLQTVLLLRIIAQCKEPKNVLNSVWVANKDNPCWRIFQSRMPVLNTALHTLLCLCDGWLTLIGHRGPSTARLSTQEYWWQTVKTWVLVGHAMAQGISVLKSEWKALLEGHSSLKLAELLPARSPRLTDCRGAWAWAYAQHQCCCAWS